ncbi:MAG: hypothetical protein KDA57_19935 [Planctomycetales bacterium]|nr:hypothetical protein [Planctomycetales bacterium]
MANRKSSFDTGIAAEYFVLSQLHRLGVEAYLSQGNTKAIDIRVVHPNGRGISIDVKAVRGCSSLVVNNVVPKKDHFLAFVVYNDKFEQLDTFPSVYIVPSTAVPEITKVFGKERRVMKGSLAPYLNGWKSLQANITIEADT